MANDRLQFLFESIVGGRYIRREMYQLEIYKTLVEPSLGKDDKIQALVDMITPVDSGKIITCLGEDASFLDVVVDNYAGEKSVIQALEIAQVEKLKRDALLEQIRTTRLNVDEARSTIQDHNASLRALNDAVNEVKRDLLYVFKSDKREQVRVDQKKIRSGDKILQAGIEDLRGREEDLAALSNQYRQMTVSEDFQQGQRLLNAFIVVTSDLQGHETFPAVNQIDIESMARHLGERMGILSDAQKMAGMTKLDQALR
jgi:hypothetical protein